jgi:hypothetical protein
VRGRKGRRTRAAGGLVLSGPVLCGLLAVLSGGWAAAAKAPPPLGTVVVADPGPGYRVTSEGPLDASAFASRSPDPAATSSALAPLAGTVANYQRAWQDAGGANEVQDLLLRFPSTRGAQAFVAAARRALAAGEIVSSGPLAGVPGARRTTYFASTTPGVGQAITMRAGLYVDLLSLFSAASAVAPPITPADAARVAQAQHAAMVATPDGSPPLPRPTAAKKRLSLGSLGAAALVVVVLAAALVTPALLRRRHSDGDTVGVSSRPPGNPSG